LSVGNAFVAFREGSLIRLHGAFSGPYFVPSDGVPLLCKYLWVM
jgi:hypothetical protein